MDDIKQRLTELLQQKYDKEFADIAHLISDAYLLGEEQGKSQAKADILTLIQKEVKI